MTSSRIANTYRNMLFAMISQITTVLLTIASRAVFVKTLNAEYMGTSGLFSNILSILSLAELGVGTAITYSLYKPISDNNHERIKSFMRLYKHIYWGIGCFIFIIGCILLPFIDSFIREKPNIPNLNLIFLLFVFQSSTTYFFSYKTQFLTATQNDYILQKFKIAFTILQVTLQIGYLYIFREYLGFLLIGIIVPFMNNVLASRYVDRLFPYLKEKAIPLTKDDLKPIKRNVFALFLYRVAQNLSATIDTLIVSKFIGIIEVAIYYNYHFLLSFANVLFTNILGMIAPSLGNLLVSEANEKKVQIFETLQFVYYWIGTLMGVAIIVLFNTFIELWLGTDYLFNQTLVVALAVSSTVTNFQRPCAMMRDTGGLFWYGRYRPVASSIINIVASVCFVKFYGVIGVVMGTVLSKLLTYAWYDPYIVFKYAISSSLKRYYYRYLSNWCIFGFLAYLCDYLYKQTNTTGTVHGLIIGACIVVFVVNGFFYLFFRHSYGYIYLKDNFFKKILNV